MPRLTDEIIDLAATIEVSEVMKDAGIDASPMWLVAHKPSTGENMLVEAGLMEPKDFYMRRRIGLNTDEVAEIYRFMEAARRLDAK